jgi:hypothetical protein
MLDCPFGDRRLLPEIVAAAAVTSAGTDAVRP